MTTHILALGGGGFSMSNRGEPTALDRHILDLSGKSSPLVCFAPTAAADDPVYVNRFLAAYSALGVRNMVLTLWQGAAESVERLSQGGHRCLWWWISRQPYGAVEDARGRPRDSAHDRS